MPPIISNLPTKQITYTDGKAHLNLHLLPEKEKKRIDKEAEAKNISTKEDFSKIEEIKLDIDEDER